MATRNGDRMLSRPTKRAVIATAVCTTMYIPLQAMGYNVPWPLWVLLGASYLAAPAMAIVCRVRG